MSQQSLELNYDTQKPSVQGNNTFHTLSYRQKMGKYLLNTGASLSTDNKNLFVGIVNGDYKIGDVVIKSKGEYFNQKTVLERKIKNASNVKAGYEINISNDIFNTEIFNAKEESRSINNTNIALFLETNLGITPDFSVSAGVRSEHSSFLHLWNIAPRISAAYRLTENWVTSVAYGQFFQNPEAQYLSNKYSQPFQKANHYILQIQRSANKRTFRTEIFYKGYKDLEKSFSQNFVTNPTNIIGKGYAKGLEVFFSDKQSFGSFNYRVSYSYLDSKRDYLNYPQELFPSFASKHNLSVTGSKFISKWKSGLSMSFVYASPRPYYNIVPQNNINFLMSQGKTKEYKALNISGYYLPNLGKKEAKSFTILVAGINNVFGFKNDFGYRFSQMDYVMQRLYRP